MLETLVNSAVSARAIGDAVRLPPFDDSEPDAIAMETIHAPGHDLFTSRGARRCPPAPATSGNALRSGLACLLVGTAVLALSGCGGGGGSSSRSTAMVTVSPTVANVMVDQQIQLGATVTDSAGNAQTGTVTWTSGNAAVATVNSAGLVIAHGLGQVTITATSEGHSGAAVLTATNGYVFASISAGGDHTCGVTLEGVAYCWGDNSSGQLGNGTLANSATPVPVSGALSFAMISAGKQHSCGITGSPTIYPPAAGVVYCWGDNGSGQLGNGTTINSEVPVAVSGGNQYLSVSAGSKHSCGISAAQTLYCWGDNAFGQLGNGTTIASTTPVAVSAMFPWQQVSAGTSHTCYQKAGLIFFTNFAFCWGDNSAGQFGNGTTASSDTPVLIFTDYFYGPVSAGTLYTCVSSHGPSQAMCAGNNTFGQLGNGTTTNSSVLLSVVDNRNQPLGFSSEISAGGAHACGVIGQDAYCWGNNGKGQLGNGTTTNSAIPFLVVGGLHFGSLSAGDAHSCGVVTSNPPGNPPSGGAAYCWGDNAKGQLGNSWSTSSSIPVNVAGSS
ncbi:MAG TPA: Ig-like domain-containing protein [Casimicrobiaceae bacterium]|jgi:alpha-tubulin suppressor-like RCC1 family protein|nr:Ig-like domain-containing protein [Casimicrobiaceae bacterium]